MSIVHEATTFKLMQSSSRVIKSIFEMI